MRKIGAIFLAACVIALAFWQFAPRIAHYFSPPEDITINFHGKNIIMMSSLPIRHKGAQSMADIVAGKGEDNPFYLALAENNAVEMVDHLFFGADGQSQSKDPPVQDFFPTDESDGDKGESESPAALNGGLQQADLLILAQNRTLTPEEFLAVDDYARSGGHIMIFADPALHWTKWDGDNADHHDILSGKIQTMALFSPLFDHWGLDFLFEEGEAELQNGVILFDAGQFAIKSSPSASPSSSPSPKKQKAPNCRLLFQGYAASCQFPAGTNQGQGGKVILLGDADILHPLLLGGVEEQTKFQRNNRKFLSQFMAQIFD